MKEMKVRLYSQMGCCPSYQRRLYLQIATLTHVASASQQASSFVATTVRQRSTLCALAMKGYVFVVPNVWFLAISERKVEVLLL